MTIDEFIGRVESDLPARCELRLTVYKAPNGVTHVSLDGYDYERGLTYSTTQARQPRTPASDLVARSTDEILENMEKP